MRRLVLRSLALCGILLALPAHSWPKITLGEEVEFCREVYEVADAIYRSTSSIRSEFKAMQLFTRETVLGPAEPDLTGGDSLKTHPDVFDKVRNRHNVRGNTYWQKVPYGDYRFVLHETPVGWRGDIYNLFEWPADSSIEEFWDHFAKYRHMSDVESAFISGAWDAPLVFSTDESDGLWVFDVGRVQGLGHYFGTWEVYSVSVNGADLACKIAFGPEVEHAFLLLPEPVRALAELLELTLGQDTGATLMPIARIAFATRTSWANAVFRPWIRAPAYNTRTQVERGLGAWAENDEWNRDLYERIKAQYPQAERALAVHYEEQFHYSSDDASSLAREVLDSVYRQHYVFRRSP
ncbi:hypothetical protein [Thioalkalivibrio thiocyanodenitrificans]|uniref:hypothetical protein n=1 Tax=Thioalkalivibrio thiocyanodenitrificans TaxID=243063 RepID=UPI0003806198|nr:hypothetical protein [Thioalkalivibrio thiocyanodenitrificans]